MTDSDSIRWFVARTRRRQELSVRNRLEEFGIRNFVPVCETLKVRNGRKYRTVTPLIPNMVFLQTTKQTACSLANGHGLPVHYVIDRSTGSMLVVPDRQMDDFIRVLTEQPQSVELTEFSPQRGQKVRISAGRLAGLEGQVLEAGNDTCLVISVGTLLNARVKVPTNCLEPL